MATLLMRLCAPMQAWGTQSHFSHRDTGHEPSKSGVIGLLCAALGRPRRASIDDLSTLRMGVRVDCEGAVRRDYHTAGMGGVYKVSGGVKKSLIPSDRYYLADAKFLVGLEGDLPHLSELQSALQNPKWFLFLGRKAFIPAERIWLVDGLQDQSLEQALTDYPWLGSPNPLLSDYRNLMRKPPEHLRVVIEAEGGDIVRHDRVVSFETRRFLPRRMHTYFIPPQLPDEIEE